MDITKELTVIIPVRIDCIERMENLDAVLYLLLKTTSAYVIILEASNKQKYFYNGSTDRIKYIFIEDHDPIFYRTHYLNQLLKIARTDIVGIWDTDVIIKHQQIEKAVYKVQKGVTLCYPYDGKFIFLDMNKSAEVKKDILRFLNNKNKENNLSFFGRPSVGGAFIVNKNRYLYNGGENENFYGWGAEDAERYKRMEILGEPIARIPGSLYHLYHTRGINSIFGNSERDINNVKEFLKICRMNTMELRLYVDKWRI